MARKFPAHTTSDGRRLLVVDDDREIRDLLSALLTRRGYKVVTAREEQEMRQILETSRVDLIILDVMLPGKDGLTICRELRATKAIPIIMLTSRGEPMDRIVGLEMGADDYLPKPFEVASLKRGSRPYCGGRKLHSPPRGYGTAPLVRDLHLLVGR